MEDIQETNININEATTNFRELESYLINLENRFNEVISELHEVKLLIKDNQSNNMEITDSYNTMTDKLEQQVADLSSQIAVHKQGLAKNFHKLLDEAKEKSIEGLDKFIGFIGLKKALISLKYTIENKILDINFTLYKIHKIGNEINEVKNHSQNVFELLTGKYNPETKDREYGSNVIHLIKKPYESLKNILYTMEDMTDKAISSLEKLERPLDKSITKNSNSSIKNRIENFKGLHQHNEIKNNKSKQVDKAI